MAIAKFRSGEGVVHEADENSMAFELMSKGGFVRLEDESAEDETPHDPAPMTDAPAAKKPRSALRKKTA